MNKNRQSKQLGINSVIDVIDDDLSQEAKNILYILSNQEKVSATKGLTLSEIKTFYLILETIDL